MTPEEEGEATTKPLADPTTAHEFKTKAAQLFPLSAHFEGLERSAIAGGEGGEGGGGGYERFEFDDVAEAFGRLVFYI